MSSIALPLQTAVPVADSLAPVAVVLLGGGLVGMSIRNMFESIISEEDEVTGDEGEPDTSTDGGAGLMADDAGDAGDAGDDDLGGLGGLDDDDDLGGFDDDGGFGEMDEAGGGDVDELEHRLDELEAEVGSLSSTVNTVRNENEQISESVEEVEENVRKLLDIYEMVTRGVNPFADDIDAGMAGGMGDQGGFGLFADDDGGGEPDEIDEDIAEADAEGFFDEDLVEDDEELQADADVGDVLGDDGGGDGDSFDDEFDEDFDDFDEGGDTGGSDTDGSDTDGSDDGDGGTSFQDLKEEYESGDADWAEGETESDEPADEAAADAEFEEMEGGDEAVDEELDDLADDELFDEVIEDDAEPASDADGPPAEAETKSPAEEAGDESEPAADPVDAEESTPTDEAVGADTADEPAAPPADAAGGPTGQDTGPAAGTAEAAQTTEQHTASAGAGDGATAPAAGDGRPYLATLPDGFAADLLVIEWLEYLVSEAGVRETARAVDYYESIDWIAEPVADELDDYLAAFDEAGSGTLTIDHHTRSLRYIGRLDGGGADAVALQRLTHGGGSDGIQH